MCVPCGELLLSPARTDRSIDRWVPQQFLSFEDRAYRSLSAQDDKGGVELVFPSVLTWEAFNPDAMDVLVLLGDADAGIVVAFSARSMVDVNTLRDKLLASRYDNVVKCKSGEY
jgi:hypothetical protein